MKKRPARGIRKYIRIQKAIIRKEVFDEVERKRKFAELYSQLGIEKDKKEKENGPVSD